MVNKQKRKKYTVHFDNAKAKEVFSIIKSEWDKKEESGVFHGLVLPQDNYIPSYLSEKELSLLFFYAVLGQRGSIDSDRPMKIWAEFRKRVPEAFDTAFVLENFSSEMILSGLWETIGANNTRDRNKPNRGFKLKEISEFWIYNSEELLKFWDGDPRNIFSGVNNFKDAFKRIERKAGKTAFKGIGMKVFALLTIYLQERNLISIFPTPLPVDFHTLRILWATGIIKRSGWIRPCSITKNRPEQIIGKPAVNIYYEFPNRVAYWSTRFMRENGFSHLDMNPAIWLLSRSLCSKNFQNTSRKEATQYIDAYKLANDFSLWPRDYKDPCRICPIERHCKWIIPSAPYWKWGLLVKLGRRVSFPRLL